ncbi:MAG: membrane protein insertase YidC [Rickettsiaceae bacterium]|nr:membrane protein insertase YidC [Rickettsiaceae bacterium]
MQNQNLNLVLAFILSIGIIAGWQYFFERPRLKQISDKQRMHSESIKKAKSENIAAHNQLSKEEALAEYPRIKFSNSVVEGSINLKGLRFDDLRFKKYKEDISSESANITLLEPNGTKKSYFAEIGWITQDAHILMPNQDSIWQCDKNKIEKNETVLCKWHSPSGLSFRSYITLDDNYIFNIRNEVENHSAEQIHLQSYGIIHKIFKFEASQMSIVHEGVSSVAGGELNELTYKEIEEKKKISQKQKNIDWMGINDKYWLVAILPDKGHKYSTNANFLIKNGLERFQVDIISDKIELEKGAKISLSHNLFGGAKELELLDHYETTLKVKLFDRTVDFGWFYIITKPLLTILHLFYDLVGNFGISIMIVTVLVKLSMLGLANKSYKSMKIMKYLAPQMEQIKTRYANDQVKMNQEIMNLYKQHKVNPLSGCLPILIQIPVFFSLYKVLNVAIDMRHAPFFGWILDLSAPDPTNIFNLFGLIPFTPPSFLHIGLWPIFMALTMYLQQRMQPPTADPVQAQVMQMMPLMFLFMFSNFPAGLLIYWTWNNILSIAQQSYINYSNDK